MTASLVETVARASTQYSVYEMGLFFAVLHRSKWLQKDAVFKSKDRTEARDHCEALNARAAIAAVLADMERRNNLAADFFLRDEWLAAYWKEKL